MPHQQRRLRSERDLLNGPSGVLCTCAPGYTGTGLSCASDDYVEWPLPPDDPLEAEYTVSADGTIVMDRVTGLVWQRELYAGACPADDDAGDGCTYAHAQAYCTSLNLVSLGGLSSGWRLPSLVELISIVNFTDGTPTIDTSPFPGTPLTSFWTNTRDAADPTQSWALSFANGVNATQPVATVSPVRCVNSSMPLATTPTCGLVGEACCYAESCAPDATCNAGTCGRAYDYAQVPPPPDSPPEAQYAVSSDGSIAHDPKTGLYWQRNVPASECPADGAGCTWADATAYCQSLDGIALGGITSAWRVPTLLELVSIVNYGQSQSPPLIDTSIFGNTTTAQAFWAATENAQNLAQAWAVLFADGSANPAAVTTPLPVRCVSAAAPAATTTCGLASEACCYANGCGAGLTCSAATCITDVTFDQGPVPSDFPLEANFAVSSDGILVKDKTTGLYWQRQTFASPCPSDGSGVCTWADAAAYCASLDTNVLGGITSGWRLPSVVELIGIMNYGDLSTPPALDTAIFPPTALASFWTATPDSQDKTQSWLVSATTGVNSVAPTTSANAVRCVSPVAPTASPTGCGLVGDPCCYAESCGAQLACTAAGTSCVVDENYAQVVTTDTPHEAAYTLSPGGSVVTDKATGLVWQRDLEATPCPTTDAGTPGCSWTDAATYCTAMNGRALGGYASGWRLPSIHELVSIVSYDDRIRRAVHRDVALPGDAAGLVLDEHRGRQRAGVVVHGELRRREHERADDGDDPRGAMREPGGDDADARGVRRGEPVVLHDQRVRRGPRLRERHVRPRHGVHALDASARCACRGGVHDRRGRHHRRHDGAQVGAEHGDGDVVGRGHAMRGARRDAREHRLAAPHGGRAGLELVSYGTGPAPYVQGAVFNQVTSNPYWTSTVQAGGSGEAWSVTFADGSSALATTTTSMNVICVSSN